MELNPANIGHFPAMAGPGRDTKFTPAVRRSILTALRKGVPRKFAAGGAGVGERTFLRWLRRGREEKTGEYMAFLAAVKKAESDAIGKYVGIIARAAPKNWKAAAWMLERRNSEEFGSSQREIIELKRQLAELLKRLPESAGSELGTPPSQPTLTPGPLEKEQPDAVNRGDRETGAVPDRPGDGRNGASGPNPDRPA